MIHKLKIQKRYADRIMSNQKTFEVRVNDRDYQVGDFIEFYCVLDDKCSIAHEIKKHMFKITYLLQGIVGIEPGYCVFEIVREEDNDKHE